MKAYILDESAISGAAADELHVELHDGHIAIVRFDGSEVVRIASRREVTALAYQLCLAADAADPEQFTPIVPRTPPGAPP